MKLLYLVKHDLDNTNPIKEKLSFYWYLNGPYSTVIEREFDLLCNAKLVLDSQISNIQVYHYDPSMLHSRLTHNDKYLEDARNSIIKNLDNYTNVDNLMNVVYDHAPSDFYKSYHLGLQYNICALYLHAKSDDEKIAHYTNRVIDLLDDSILDVPSDSGFYQFRLNYKKFTRSLYVLCEVKHYEPEHLKLLQQLLQSVEIIWTAFAHLIRVYYHDPIYENNTPTWRNVASSKLDEMSSNLTALEYNVFEICTPKPLDIDVSFNPENSVSASEYLKKLENI